jgi:hypothetical protein
MFDFEKHEVYKKSVAFNGMECPPNTIMIQTSVEITLENGMKKVTGG